MPETQSQRITESRVLAAVASPARARIVDILAAVGPSTASAIAEHARLAVGSASHHLRVLADAGLVQEAPELARDRRERWWRLVTDGFRWSSSDFASDPVSAAAESAAAHQSLQRQFERSRDWLARSTGEAADQATGATDPTPTDLVDAAFATQSWLTLSAEELAEVSEEVTAVLRRWRQRDLPGDDTFRQPVFVFARGFPSTP